LDWWNASGKAIFKNKYVGKKHWQIWYRSIQFMAISGYQSLNMLHWLPFTALYKYFPNLLN